MEDYTNTFNALVDILFKAINEKMCIIARYDPYRNPDAIKRNLCHIDKDINGLYTTLINIAKLSYGDIDYKSPLAK